MEKEQKINHAEIYSDWDASRIDMAQSILRSKGIESVVSDTPAKVSFGKRLNMHIMVAPSEAHRAKEILQDTPRLWPNTSPMLTLTDLTPSQYAPSQYPPSVSNLISGTYLFQKVGLKWVLVILLIIIFLILFALFFK